MEVYAETLRRAAPAPLCGEPALSTEGRPPDLLTIALEDYFQVAPLRGVVASHRWYRFEKRVEQNTTKTLELLDLYGAHATFFVVGWLAEELPELVRLIAERGHEVASKGFFHRSLAQLDREAFREDLRRSREALERASGRRVVGHRIAHGWFGPGDLWALDILAQEGFAYDSSLRPLLRGLRAQPQRRFPHRHPDASGSLWEFPLSALELAGLSLPISGGNYQRQFPDSLVRRAVERWHRTCSAPFLMYFHVWDLDPDQPRIQGTPLLQRVRQYRNLDKMEGVIRGYLARYRFTSIAEHLELDLTRESQAATPARIREKAAALARTAAPAHPPASRPDVTVVVPCYNEAQALPYLKNTLESVATQLADRYRLRFLFVDDGSEDRTWSSLADLFGRRSDCALVRHERNRGVAAAILTGIRDAQTELVCSIDADCTYDPHQLDRLLARLGEDVAMVTASPYHPDGRVVNVSRPRLLLSRGLSSLYRLALGLPLHTFTSCFRAYRRSAVAGLELENGGFLGVAELLGRLSLAGGRIVECPAVLEARILGRSKMRIARTALGHLVLLGKIVRARLLGSS